MIKFCSNCKYEKVSARVKPCVNCVDETGNILLNWEPVETKEEDGNG